MTLSQEAHAQLADDGFILLPSAFAPDVVETMTEALNRVFAERGSTDTAIRGDEGAVYAARNLLRFWTIPRTRPA
jgi:hypothetical protein